VNRVETPKVPKPEAPKSRSPEDNLDHSSKETHVRRSTCSGIRRSGETGYAKVKSPEARSPEVTWPADVTRDDMDTWDVCHMSVS
jgi:hypothetical protein